MFLLNRKVVQSSVLFRGLPKALKNLIAANLIEDLYLPHDVVFSSGQPATYLYFLSIGTVAMYLKTGEEVGHLEDGDYFGIISALLPEFKGHHLGSFIALEICEIFKLPYTYIHTVLSKMPRLYSRLRAAALSRAHDMIPLIESVITPSESSDESEISFGETEERESTSSLDPDVLRELKGRTIV